MKKLLNTLAIVTLLGSSTASVVACGNGKGPIDPGQENLTDTQKEMLDGAEFISRLIVGGRHENLNYNINEILSIFLTPSPTAMNMPQSYKYKGKSINIASEISKYKNYLAPSMNYYNGDNYAGMFASYIMGMYEDDFYNNMINGFDGEYYFNDTFSKEGNQGYNKKDNKNAMGYAAGLGADINLSRNEDRRNLAWGIQDTGALSNYLLNLGFDGANPTDTNGTAGPASSASVKKGGTNGSGYAWYNSVLMNGQASKSVDFKPNDNQVTKKMNEGTTFSKADSNNKSTVNGIQFNSTGAIIAKTAGEQNIKGYISLFGSMLENISDTKNGALVFGEFMNNLFPMIKNGSSLLPGNANNIMQSVGLSLTSKVWVGIKEMAKKDIPKEMENKINELDSAPTFSFLGQDSPDIKNLYGVQPRDAIVGNEATNATDIVELIDEIVNLYEKSTDKKQFITDYFVDSNSPFYKAYKSTNPIKRDDVISYIGEENWANAMYGDNNDGAINLLKMSQRLFKMLTEEGVREEFNNIMNLFKGKKSFRDLTVKEKDQYLELIGYSEKGYDPKSIGGRIFNAFTNSEITGQKDFYNFFDGFKDYIANEMSKVHDPVLKYLVDDNYWDVDDVKMTSTSNTQAGAKMEFTLGYEGIGDTTSKASKQTKKVTVDQSFNPYQTKVEHQSNEINALKEKGLLDQDKINSSGKILGIEQGVIKEEQLKDYDGQGNYDQYSQVNNKYKIVWENISKNPASPYWVITSIKCFNANGEEFYNIY